MWSPSAAGVIVHATRPRRCSCAGVAGALLRVYEDWPQVPAEAVGLRVDYRLRLAVAKLDGEAQAVNNCARLGWSAADALAAPFAIDY